MVVIATDDPKSHSHLSSEWPSVAFCGGAVLLNKKMNSAFEVNTYAGKLRYNQVDNIDYHVKSIVENVVKEKLQLLMDVFTNAIANVLESLNVDRNPILNNFNAALRDNLLNKSNKEILKLSEDYLNYPYKSVYPSNLTISLFNAQSILSKIDQIKDFLVSKNIDILCINESWLNANQKLKIQNYDIKRLNRINERGGGVCIIINKKINYQIVSLNPNEEIQVVKIYDKHLCADPLLLSKIADLGDNVLLLGDLNAHYSMWSSRLTNKAGEQIVDFIFEKDFCLLNDESPTYQPMHHPDYKATLDLAIASSSLMSDFIAFRVDDYIYIDHYPFNEKGYVVKTIRTFNQEHFYKQAVLNCANLIGFQKTSKEDIEIYTEMVTKAINQAHEYANSFKVIRIREGSYYVLPKHIKKLINLKRRARDKFKKTRKRSDKYKFKWITKKVKNEIKDHKFEQWSEFCKSLHKVSDGKLWKKLRQIDSSDLPEANKIPKNVHNSESISDPKKLSEMFAESLFTTFSNQDEPSFDEVFKTEVINQIDSFFKYDSIEFEPSTVDEI
ncbi:unnamed protein product [Brachionus calyciflorus]|uniref:Endonuclease/exonuclease/phosphatase domain-containing protein n=1 Tax=Brachionus calyciflorus TaxID=104777 RepID=A0A813M8Q2_9BILA|nr:unnamed protein product [Brachionus calyciflorus]